MCSVLGFRAAHVLDGVVIAALSGAASWRGVVISNRALAWQKARAKPQVTIEFEHAAVTRPEPHVIDMGKPLPPPDLFYELTVNVINAGETTEFVTGPYVQQPPHATGYSPEQDIELKPHS